MAAVAAAVVAITTAAWPSPVMILLMQVIYNSGSRVGGSGDSIGGTRFRGQAPPLPAPPPPPPPQLSPKSGLRGVSRSDAAACLPCPPSLRVCDLMLAGEALSGPAIGYAAGAPSMSAGWPAAATFYTAAEAAVCLPGIAAHSTAKVMAAAGVLTATAAPGAAHGRGGGGRRVGAAVSALLEDLAAEAAAPLGKVAREAVVVATVAVDEAVAWLAAAAPAAAAALAAAGALRQLVKGALAALPRLPWETAAIRGRGGGLPACSSSRSPGKRCGQTSE